MDYYFVLLLDECKVALLLLEYNFGYSTQDLFVKVETFRRNRPEKQQECLFVVRAGFNFLDGAFGALVMYFLTPLTTHTW